MTRVWLCSHVPVLLLSCIYVGLYTSFVLCQSRHFVIVCDLTKTCLIVLGFTLCEASDLWLLVLWFNTLPSNVPHLLSSLGICNPRFSAPNIVGTNQEKKKKDLELCQTFLFVLKPCGTFKNRLALIKFMVKIWSEIQNEELGPCVSINCAWRDNSI